MSLDLKQLEAEALYLPAEQRADLAQRLFESVEDEDVEDVAQIEQASIEEAERRYQRYRAGETQPVPAAEAIACVRARLKSL